MTEAELRIESILLACGLTLSLAGCETARFQENEPFSGEDPQAGYRYDNLAPFSAGNSEEVFVILTFSGGGTRAAAFAFGVLEKLGRTTIEVGGETRTLLQEVDVISSTSGGSYTAAYFGLFREGMFNDQPEEELHFTRRFLERDIENEIASRIFLSPVNWFRLASYAYNRSDLAAEFYHEEIFEEKTFGDLIGRGRPFIIINANDTTKGTRFEFTQEHFDLICSDLSGYPVARAVMASSAVHGLFGVIRLRNYDKANCKEPDWVGIALGEATNNRGDLDANRARYERAKLARSYRDKDGTAIQKSEYYVHLADGGAVDNLGLRAPLLSLRSTDPSWSVLRKLNLKKIKTIIVISVNAASQPDNDLDKDIAGPGPISLIASAISGAIDTVTLDSIEVTDSKIRERIRSLEALSWPVMHYGPILIDFEHIEDANARRCFRNIGTRLTLSSSTTRGLREVAYQLIRESPEFQKMLSDMGGQEKPMPELLPGQPLCDR